MENTEPTKGEQVETKGTLSVTFAGLEDIQVTSNGYWNGTLIRGVIRAIEKHYKKIKYDAMREGIKQRQLSSYALQEGLAKPTEGASSK